MLQNYLTNSAPCGMAFPVLTCFVGMGFAAITIGGCGITVDSSASASMFCSAMPSLAMSLKIILAFSPSWISAW